MLPQLGKTDLKIDTLGVWVSSLHGLTIGMVTVYILRSKTTGKYYIGSTKEKFQRNDLLELVSGLSNSFPT
jgi:hypothetical protein